MKRTLKNVPNENVPGPDLGTGPREMRGIANTYHKYKGHEDIHALAVCTGKPLNYGGIEGRVESTGLGVYYAVRELMKRKKIYEKYGLTEGISGKTFIVQVWLR